MRVSLKGPTITTYNLALMKFEHAPPFMPAEIISYNNTIIVLYELKYSVRQLSSVHCNLGAI